MRAITRLVPNLIQRESCWATPRTTEPAAHYIQTGLMIQVHLDLNNYDLGHVIRLVAGLAASHHTKITPYVRRRGGIMRALQKLFSVLAGRNSCWRRCSWIEFRMAWFWWNSIFINEKERCVLRIDYRFLGQTIFNLIERFRLKIISDWNNLFRILERKIYSNRRI